MKRKKNLRYSLIFIIFLLLPNSYADYTELKIRYHGNKQYLSVFDIINILKLDYSFDLISRRGKIYRKNHYAVYREGYSYIVIDGILINSGYPVVQIDGEIIIPIHSARMIIEALFPRSNIKIEAGALIVEFNKAPVRKLADNKKGNVRKRDKDRIGFIIIDPGHGGKDPGAIGRRKTKEKVITLKIAKFLKRQLRKRIKGVKIRLTRSSDRFIELSNRIFIANRYLEKNSNGLFLSIHVNASLSKKISGFETYFLSQNPTNDEARNTAALENNVIILEDKSSKKKYRDVDYIEAMMITTQIQKESSILASSIQRGMAGRIRHFKSRGVRKADFYVLRGALMPAVLIEVGFITNRKELNYLKKRWYQNKIAGGITRGILNFIKKYNRTLK